MDCSSYKSDELERPTKEEDKASDVIQISENINLFNEMDFNETESFANFALSIIKTSSEIDFSSLISLNFFSKVIEFILKGSKPRIFLHCVEFVNCILENPKSADFQKDFYNEEFLDFVLKTSTFIRGQEEPMIPLAIYNNSPTIYSKLLSTLLLLIQNENAILEMLQNENIISRLCNLYLRDANLLASNKALELLKYILSQQTFEFDPESFQPIYELIDMYFTKVYGPEIKEKPNDGTPIPLLDKERDSWIRYQDFSNFCELAILLAKIDSSFLSNFNIHQLFGLLTHTNDDSANALLDLILYIFSFDDLPPEFIDSIEWSDVDVMIQSFNAVESGNNDFLIKLCRLLNALSRYKPLLKEEIQDLLYFIDNGSVNVQLEACQLLCNLYLNSKARLSEFDIPILDILVPSLCDIFSLIDDSEYFYSFLQLLSGFTDILIAENNELIIKIQDLWKDDDFQKQFDVMHSEEILALQQELSYRLNVD